MGNLNVMLILEGTYPFNEGGVSTWAHTLCQQVHGVDFTLCALTAKYYNQTKFQLPPAVKETIQIPMWAPDEPASYPNYKIPYHTTLLKKRNTTHAVIKAQFLPPFQSLLAHLYNEQDDIAALDAVLRSIWNYFRTYDYSETMKSQPVWESYVNFMDKYGADGIIPIPVMMDLTVGMRWLFRLLLPISIPVPKVDLVHLTMSGFALLPALAANYAYNTPCILTEHGVFIRERLLAINSSGYSFFLKDFLIRFSEAIAKLAYYKSKRIYSVNTFNQTWEMRYGAPKHKLECIYNGIDHQRFSPRDKPDSLRNTPTVVALARIFELKDIITMIETCALVAKQIPNVQFLVYGDTESVPEYTQRCRSRIAQLELEDNFFLKGAKPNPQLLFSEGDISILTSISEGFPYTVLESMSCGIPVVATDVGGTSEALDHGKSGYICKPKDAQALANRTVALLNDKALRQQMGRHARQRIISLFSESRFVTAYKKAYRDALTPVQLPQHTSKPTRSRDDHYQHI
jgi:glycosyltransferase involved in cell wall biosynthesis